MLIYTMSYDIDQITQTDGFIHIYCDASFAKNKSTLGIAWVIATQDIKKPIIRSLSSDRAEITKSTSPSLSGEFSAVLLALQDMPEDTKIILHTDNKTVFLDLNALLRHGNTREQANPIINEIINHITTELAKLPTVIIEHSNDNEYEESDPLKRYYMTHAHNAAADASGANSKKELPDPYAKMPKKPQRTHDKKPPPKHDTSGAMEIINLGNGNGNKNEMPFEYSNGNPPPKPKP